MSQLGDVIRAAQTVPRNVAEPATDPWLRWLETPDHLVALIDRTGETTVTYRHEGVAGAEAQLVGAPGAVRGSTGRVTVSVRELTDGPAAVLLPKR
jgi:alpha-L-fucosidase